MTFIHPPLGPFTSEPQAEINGSGGGAAALAERVVSLNLPCVKIPCSFFCSFAHSAQRTASSLVLSVAMRRRRDGRSLSDLRPLSCDFGLLGTADGSCRLSSGATLVLASVHGPRPARTARHEDPERARLEVHAAPPIGLPGPAEAELCALLRQVLAPVLVLSAHPRSVVTLSVHVQADDGSAPAVALNAAVLALVDAGVPLRGLLGAVTLGWGLGGGEVPGAALDLSAAEAAGAGARGLAVYAAQGCAAGTGEGEGEEGGEGPLALVLEGPVAAGALSDALRGAARPAAGAVVDFMRAALREKVLRDALHFEGGLVATLEELRAGGEAGGEDTEEE